MADRSRDSFQTRSELSVGSSKFTYFSLPKFAEKTGKDLSFSERKLLDTARSLLVKELALARRVKEQIIEGEISAIFGLAA